MVTAVDRITWPTSLAYGFAGLPLALLAISFYVYIPKFYADVVGVNLSMLATIVLASRIWDAVLDPSIGLLSDRTRSRFGRRKPWIAAAIIPLIISFFLLGSPSLSNGILSPEAWLSVWTFVFFFFWTLFVIPYEALGAELSFEYHERTRLFAVRDGGTVLGTLLAACAPLLLEHCFPGLAKETRIQVLCAIYGTLLLAAAVMLLSRISEASPGLKPKNLPTPLEGLSHVLRCAPFRILLASYTIGAFGATLPATLILFYVEHVLGGSEAAAYQFLGLYFLVGFLFLPAWLRVARSIGKKEAWLGAMFVNTAAFAGVFFLGKGDFVWYGLLVALSAVGYGAALALPSSMQADVIDLDELDHGTRKEGQFIGIWSIAKKLSAALGAGVALKVLGASGYQPDAVQSTETVHVLRVLYAAVPCACNFAAIALAWRYPISRELHEEIRRRIDQRNTEPAFEVHRA